MVDDNNPDSEARSLTEAIMSNYSNNQRVRYIKHDFNRNGSAARNTGARAALGEWLAFLDDDDEFLPKKIESQLLALKNREDEWACCYSRYAYKKPGKKLVKSNENREGNLYLEALMREFHIASGSNLLVKKTAFEAINGFDESFIRNQDIEFLARLMKLYKIAYSEYCGLIVNLHFNHGYFDEQEIINQYVERFNPYVSVLSKKEQSLFYKTINQQRFFDYLRVKHNYGKCITMIQNKELSLLDAITYTMKRLYTFIKK